MNIKKYKNRISRWLLALTSVLTICLSAAPTFANNMAERDQARAIKILQKARAVSPDYLEYALQQAEMALRGATFIKAEECRDNVIAYVVPLLSLQTVFLCDLYFELTALERAETLIHEAAHMIGIFDECRATWFEFMVMYMAKEKSRFKNGYANACGLDPFPPEYDQVPDQAPATSPGESLYP